MAEGAKLQDLELKKLAQKMLTGQRQELAELKKQLPPTRRSSPERRTSRARAAVMLIDVVRCICEDDFKEDCDGKRRGVPYAGRSGESSRNE